MPLLSWHAAQVPESACCGRSLREAFLRCSDAVQAGLDVRCRPFSLKNVAAPSGKERSLVRHHEKAGKQGRAPTG
jgi:hypothetical protein